MRFRKLRIVWSVVWGVACVLMIVLWVRSYYYFDRLGCPISSYWAFNTDSIPGHLDLGVFRYDNWESPWARQTYPLGELQSHQMVLPNSGLGFYGWYEQEHVGIRLPYWFLTAASAILALAPWLRWRFSLRTLLIAMTLVAVVLGMIVWLR